MNKSWKYLVNFTLQDLTHHLEKQFDDKCLGRITEVIGIRPHRPKILVSLRNCGRTSV